MSLLKVIGRALINKPIDSSAIGLHGTSTRVNRFLPEFFGKGLGEFKGPGVYLAPSDEEAAIWANLRRNSGEDTFKGKIIPPLDSHILATLRDTSNSPNRFKAELESLISGTAKHSKYWDDEFRDRFNVLSKGIEPEMFSFKNPGFIHRVAFPKEYNFEYMGEGPGGKMYEVVIPDTKKVRVLDILKIGSGAGLAVFFKQPEEQTGR